MNATILRLIHRHSDEGEEQTSSNDRVEDPPSPTDAPLMINAFGLLAVTLTLVFYSLEDRSPMFVLAFGGGCLASAVYGFVEGAWAVWPDSKSCGPLSPSGQPVERS